MRVLVAGATGCVGRAVANALRSRGHQVIEGARALEDSAASLRIDFSEPTTPQAWAQRLSERRIEALVNCIGILMPSRGQSFERIHAQGPIEMFHGAVQAGVKRVLQISALGVGGGAGEAGGEVVNRTSTRGRNGQRLQAGLPMPYLKTKQMADETLASLPVEWAVLRPSLVYGPGSQSAALFATLASLPVIGLPGRGRQAVQPIHVYELAEVVVRLLEQAGPLCDVHELGGPQALSYREMLAHYRAALGLPAPLWLPLPKGLMHATAWAAEALPQSVLCRDTIALLDEGRLPEPNDTARLLGRMPTPMARGLSITAPEPLIDLRVQISPAVAAAMRAALAFMWIYTALITLALPQVSGVMTLLARCGFEGPWAGIVMGLSCTLNLALGVLTLACRRPWVYALQCTAVVGYGVTAAIRMPELTLDHCGPLVKNVPVLALVAVLWLALPLPKPQGSNR